MKYHIWTEGCQMNEADSDKLAAGLANLGWVEAARADEADLAVVNTCVVRQKAEDRAVGYMSNLRRLKESRGGPDGRPDGRALQIAVMGCMVGPKTDDLRSRFPYVDVWARPQNFEVIIRALMPENDLGGEFWPETFPEPKGPTAFVPIVHGCNKFCTYCIVPYRRGREKSRTMDDIEREVRSLAAKGVREVTLLGQTVEAYGRDLRGSAECRVPSAERVGDGELLPMAGGVGDGVALEWRPKGAPLRAEDTVERGPDLADLFERISAIDGIERIRFLTSYPRDMTERIVRAVAELPKVCEHFNIPVQSGDDKVLAQMRRGYTLEEYRSCVAMIRKYAPEASRSTDVIVGFCGETEAQFENTLRLLEEVRYDKVHVAMYSPRPGTIAWRHMEDTVPAEEKSRRLHAVEALQERVGRELNARFVGTTQEVLVEGFKDDVWTGRNRGNKLVHFSSDVELAIGEMVSVRVERATAWSLQGSAVAAVTA